MKMRGTAWFVQRPRTIKDLLQPHLLEQEQPYKIIKTIVLAKIDYENSTTDMLVDRQFIEDSAALCSRGEIWKCLLIQQRGQPDGVLVMPENGCFVGWAAYYTE